MCVCVCVCVCVYVCVSVFRFIHFLTTIHVFTTRSECRSDWIRDENIEGNTPVSQQLKKVNRKVNREDMNTPVNLLLDALFYFEK